MRDSHELVELLTGWQWQAVHAARIEGASWAQIATATGTTEEQARDAALTGQEKVLSRDVRQYRWVL